MTENNDDDKEIQTEEVSLGFAKRIDPNAPQADFFISKEMLDARQEATGKSRKYAGPVSEDTLEALLEEMDSEDSGSSDAPPTECGEPSELEELSLSDKD